MLSIRGVFISPLLWLSHIQKKLPYLSPIILYRQLSTTSVLIQRLGSSTQRVDCPVFELPVLLNESCIEAREPNRLTPSRLQMPCFCLSQKSPLRHTAGCKDRGRRVECHGCWFLPRCPTGELLLLCFEAFQLFDNWKAQRAKMEISDEWWFKAIMERFLGL